MPHRQEPLREFDPYHRWLGIPPEQQPASHYRLLGIAAFENDAEVIRDAAARQMAHVRTYHLGQHAELSQRILNELGIAKACLLNPQKKAIYDTALREELERAGRMGVAVSGQPEIEAGLPPMSNWSLETLLPRVSTVPRSSSGRIVPQWVFRGKPLVGVAVGAMFLFILLGIVLSMRTKEGTLVVEIDDPEATVQVLGDEEKVLVQSKGDNGKLTLSVDPGKRRLRVEKDGLVLFTKDFVLAPGGKETIRVRLDTSVVERSADLPQRRGGGIAAGEETGEAGLTGPSTAMESAKAPSATKPVLLWDLPAGSPTPAVAPFDAATARRHQEAWAEHLGVPVEFENSIGMKFVLIPPGEFDMGSTEAEVARLVEETKLDQDHVERLRSEVPRHRVRITKPFWLSRHEVTRGMFRRFVEDRSYRTDSERDGKGGSGVIDGQWKRDPSFVWNADLGVEKSDDYPVVNVSWNDVTAFCQWLSEKEGMVFRLPTEAQWEYACRAGTTTAWHCGDNEAELQEHVWLSASESTGYPVGQLRPNAWGLCDMHGNVFEWCHDWWASDYYRTSPMDDPSGPAGGSYRVVRGGGLNYSTEQRRSAYRLKHTQRDCAYHQGFRIAAVVVPGRAEIGAPRNRAVEQGQDGEELSARASQDSEPVKKTLAMTPTPSWALPARSPPLAIAPFDAATARRHQEAWAEHLSVPVEFENSIGMQMALIPPGEFMMGSTEQEIETLSKEDPRAYSIGKRAERSRSEVPKHKVRITKPFRLSAHEVTVGQFRVFVDATNYITKRETDSRDLHWRNPGFSQTEKHPVVCVSWDDATAFCEWLSRESKARYRLPTEAEWEYACRAGSTTRWCFGDNVMAFEQYAWHERKNGGVVGTKPVGEKLPNSFGLFDMHGNSREWCSDWFSLGYYQASPVEDPRGPSSGTQRVLRDGADYWSPSTRSSAVRAGQDPGYCFTNVGFRVAMDCP